MISKDEMREHLEEGWIHCLVVFEVAGKPQKHVDDTLTAFMDQLKQEKALLLKSIDQQPAQELEDEKEFFSAFAEVELLGRSLESLSGLAFNYTPASIEILAPDELKSSARQLQNWLNDLLSKLHATSQELREERQKLRYASQNIANLIQNTITILLASGAKSTVELARLTGAPEESAKRVLEQMREQKIVKEEDEKWTLSSRAK